MVYCNGKQEQKMISETVKKHFYEEYGVSFRDLARDPKLIKSIAKTKTEKAFPEFVSGRGYPFFGEEICVKEKERHALEILAKW